MYIIYDCTNIYTTQKVSPPPPPDIFGYISEVPLF